MRQKYSISREDDNNKLQIKEYAIIQKPLKNVASSMLIKEDFSFLGGESYDDSVIVGSIKNGMDALIATLRTHNLYPIEPYAIKIAESVMALYDPEGDRSVELFFDDVDLIEKKPVPV